MDSNGKWSLQREEDKGTAMALATLESGGVVWPSSSQWKEWNGKEWSTAVEVSVQLVEW